MRSTVLWGHTEEGCVLPDCSQAEWKRILSFSCGFRCFYCAENLTPETATQDHLIPICRGGCRCCGNVVAACGRCNSMKKEKTIYEFLDMKPSLRKTTGRFYTSIISLKALCAPGNDPLLKEFRRLSEKKAFPKPAIIRWHDIHGPSINWRSRG